MKITVVTVAYNAAATIGDTLRSVAEQTHPDVEHIVVDGASTDGTVEVVRNDGQRVCTLLSEPDRGLYDAMNKGLALARGEVIGFLNADDWYATARTLEKVAAAFDQGVDIAYGHMALVEPDPPHRVRRLWREAPRDARSFALGWQPPHPATFMRTALLREVGGFDPGMRISADYLVFARCLLQRRSSLAFVPEVLTNMRAGGRSTTGLRAVIDGNRECLDALRRCRAKAPTMTIALKLARKSLQLFGDR